MRKHRFLILLLVCYLGLHNGHLALYEENSTQPYQVFPYNASLYPRIDQQALKDGIPFSSQEELSRLLEDYLS